MILRINMSTVALTVSVEAGGTAVNLKVTCPQKGQFNIRLLSSEMSAISGMAAAKTMRLAPAMGRVIDRIFYCTNSQIFKIDKTILHTEVRVSGIRLALVAEIQDDALLFKAMTVEEDMDNVVSEEEKKRIAESKLSTTHTLTKLITADDAKRLLESEGDDRIETSMSFEERAALAERISAMLRLVPLDEDDSSLFTGSKLIF